MYEIMDMIVLLKNLDGNLNFMKNYKSVIYRENFKNSPFISENGVATNLNFVSSIFTHFAIELTHDITYNNTRLA